MKPNALPVIVLALCVAAPFVSADTFDVTRVDDPVPDGCAVGDCSLREAVLAANGLAGDHTIQLGAGLHVLSIAGVDDVALEGDLDIRAFGAVVTITGAGTGVTTLDGTGMDRVLHVISGASLELEGVTVTGVDSIWGGAIRVDSGASLELRLSTISGNATPNYDGGGGLVNAGTSTIIDSTVDGNAAGTGGGIRNFGSLVLQGSTISNNTADRRHGGPGWGGGIRNSGSLSAVNTTFSGNSCLDGGAAIFGGGSNLLTNVTFANNSGPSGSHGYAVGHLSTGGSTTMQNTVVGLGTGGINFPCSGNGTFTSLGTNLGIGTAGDCGSHGGDLEGPTGLGALADNGGPTRTHRLLESSAALDAGADLSVSLTTDQRGVSRPQRSAWDVGAYEAEPLSSAPIVVNTTVDGNDVQLGDGVCEVTAGVGDCSLRAALREAVASGVEDVVVPAGTFNLTLGQLIYLAPTAATLHVTGAGSALTIVDGQAAFNTVFLAGSDFTVDLAGLTMQDFVGFSSFGGAISVNTANTLSLLDVSFIDNQGGEYGNAIRSSGTLHVDQCSFTGNGTAGNQGAIYTAGGTITTVTDSTFSSSVGSAIRCSGTTSLLRTTIQGSTGATGILNSGTLEVTDSLLHDNPGGGAASGGTATFLRTTIQDNGTFGIQVSGPTTITDSTISGTTGSGLQAFGGVDLTVTGTRFIGNVSGVFGGGISTSASGTVEISGCVFSGNTASSGGGAISVSGGSPYVANSTFSGNGAPFIGAGGALRVWSGASAQLNNLSIVDTTSGGGLAVASGSSVTLSNCLLAGNLDAGGPPLDCAITGTLTSAGFNMADDSSCGLAATGDQQGVDPMVGPLANNGGLTETRALLAGSPAIDAGDPGGSCEATDQRGIARPLDGDGDLDARCDIGAFEAAEPSSASADLELVATGPMGTVLVGWPMISTLTVDNLGPDEATSVSLVHTLPSEVVFASATPSQGGPCSESGGTVTCPLGSLAAAATAAVTLEVTPSSAGLISDSAIVTAAESDPNLANNSDGFDTLVEPDPALLFADGFESAGTGAWSAVGP